MEAISYIIVISILINLLIQSGLIFRYYYPLLLEYLNNKKTSWNKNYDRVIAVGFTICLFMSIFFTRELFKFSEGSYLIILYLIVLVFSTFLIFFIQKMGFLERTNNSSISTQEPKIKNFNCLLNENQLTYLYNELRKYSIIDEKIEKNNFYSDFLSKRIHINLTAFDLYYFHKLVHNNLNLNQKIHLNKFSDSFLTEDNVPYKYSSVRNGKNKVRNSDNAKNLNTIFMSFPK